MISTTKGRSFPAEILTPDEVEELLLACSRRAPTGERNRTLIILLYRTGLRVSEALALMPKDVDDHAEVLVVLRGKGGKRRTLGIDEACLAAIRSWMRLRIKLGIAAKAPLFCTLQGRRLSASYVRKLLSRLAGRAGIQKRVHPHGLRHSFAALAAQEGMPTNLIQQMLGHTSLRTTSRYLDHLAPTEIIDAMRRRTWRPRRRRRRADR